MRKDVSQTYRRSSCHVSMCETILKRVLVTGERRVEETAHGLRSQTGKALSLTA